jgi:plasmid stability protein
MGSISIRGVDEQLASLLKQQAVTAHKSVNQFILETLRKHVGLDKEKKFTQEYHDLDQIFGTWTEDEFQKIQGKIDAERQVDTELWK